jgi:hypothetical protein
MARRTRHAVSLDAETVLVHALEAVIGDAASVARGNESDLDIDLGDGRTVGLKVHGVSGRAEPGPVANALKKWDPELRRSPDDGSRAYGVVVAAAIPDATKAILRKHEWGWFDRRGELDLRVPGLIIHATDIAASLGEVRSDEPQKPIRGRAGVTVAASLLLNPDAARGVREIARAGDLAPSIVSTSLAELRRASLLRADGRPLLTDLFWALADAWKPRHEALQLAPTPQLGRRLDLGLGDRDELGWAVGGSLAAAAWSAPIVVGSAAAPDFYVPTEADLRAARRELHTVPMSESRGCTVAVAPTLLAVRPRHDPSSLATPGLEWPIVHPLFAALDLAQDTARGLEILEDWTPPPPFVRVW